jgi:hypothetical protein
MGFGEDCDFLVRKLRNLELSESRSSIINNLLSFHIQQGASNV